MTEREALTAAAKSAGLRLRAGDFEALEGAWRRYRELMSALAQALADDLPPG